MEISIPTPPYDDQSSRPQTMSRKSPSSASSPMSTVRASKSGNGNSSNTTASLASATSGHVHHHNSHRASKRSSTASTSSHSHHSGSSHHGSVSAASHSHGSPNHDSNDGRHKRVWKACERCRMKKTKCDGEFPCKRCKDDGLVCTAGTRKKTEYKQLPKGYAEVLENTQFALVATVHKLYAMVRAAQAWDLGEPELNERGQPVIHSIAAKLGCIRPNNDPDLPMGTSVFPEDEADLAELAAQLEEQHKQREAEQAAQAAAQAQVEAQQAQVQAQQQQQAAANATAITMEGSAPAALLGTSGSAGFDLSNLSRFERASSTEEIDTLSDMDDYRRNVFGRGCDGSVNSASTTMSPQSLTFNDFDTNSSQSDGFTTAPSPTLQAVQFANWINGRPASIDLSAQSLQRQARLQEQQQQQQQLQKLQRQRQKRSQQPTTGTTTQSPLSVSIPPSMSVPMPFVSSPTAYFGVDMLRQGLVESNFGTIKPHVLSCPNPEVMLGMGDPMIYSGGYDDVLM